MRSELRTGPLLVCQNALDAPDVLLRAPVPVAREPSTYTSPLISSLVAISEPVFFPLEAGTPDRVGIIDIEGGALVRIGPGAGMSRWKVRTSHLEKPDAVATIRIRYASSPTIP